MLTFAHRGARGHEPENTVRSVRRAIELGADWVEVDVQVVEDDLVVIHDDRLERTTDGEGYVVEHTLAHLRSLDAGGGERIPLLAEVFDTVDGRAGVNIELKGSRSAEVVAAFVRERLAAGWNREAILVSSFDHRQLRRLREIDPGIALGALIVALPLTHAAFAEELGASSVHPSLEFIDQAFVDDAHRRGLTVFPFVVNHADDIARMAVLGVDGVFTDYPERVVAGGR